MAVLPGTGVEHRAFPACNFCLFFASTHEKEETHDFSNEWVTRTMAWALSELGNNGVVPTSQIPVRISLLAMYERTCFELQFRTVSVGLKYKEGYRAEDPR